MSYEIGYGIIFLVDLFYFVSCVGDFLCIFEGIEWYDLKFIGVFVYFMEKVVDDIMLYVWGGGNGKFIVLFGCICYCI